jgi:hypothetical protein
VLGCSGLDVVVTLLPRPLLPVVTAIVVVLLVVFFIIILRAPLVAARLLRILIRVVLL